MIKFMFRKKQFALSVSKMLLIPKKNTKSTQEVVKNRHLPRKISQTGRNTKIGQRQRKMSSSEISRQMCPSMILCGITA